MESFDEWYCRTKGDIRKMVYNTSKPYYDTLSNMPDIQPVREVRNRLGQINKKRYDLISKFMPGDCS